MQSARSITVYSLEESTVRAASIPYRAAMQDGAEAINCTKRLSDNQSIASKTQLSSGAVNARKQKVKAVMCRPGGIKRTLL